MTQPSLRPAVRQGKRIHTGSIADSHAIIIERHGVNGPHEHGFVSTANPRMFLSRKQALDYLKRFEPSVYQAVRHRVPPEGLHSHIYAAAKGVVPKLDAETKAEGIPLQEGELRPEAVVLPDLVPDLSDKTAIVYDRGGLHLYWAEKLGEKFKKVMYYLADSDAYPTSQKHTIGMGIAKVTRVHDFWKHVDDADLVVFPDCYDGEMQHWLRSKGYRVFGSGRAEQLEIDKIMFMEKLKELGLPAAKTHIAHGIKELREYLTENDNSTLFLKNLHRGDFESKKFTSMSQIRPWIDDLVKRVGTASDTLEVLIQHKVDATAEIGYDGYCVDGEYTSNCVVGYEIKDVCFAGKIFPETPKLLADINEAFAPSQRELGGRGNLSTEVRVTEAGEPYYIDPTQRSPSPPGEALCEIYENWAEMVYIIAGGEVPLPKPVAPFLAELVLTSEWYDQHELHVKFPKKFKQHVKLKNHTVRDGEIYCVPNQNGAYFGAVVGWGSTMNEAIDKVKEVAESIEADEYKFDPSGFDAANEAVKAGEAFGIKF